MKQALTLAAKARGKTLPNPMVGALVVRHGEVVGRGFHERAGRPHAETIALKQAGMKAKGGTLYVTLEPCNHIGRTGPCTEAVLKSGVRRVVAAMADPNPLNQGKGLKRLKAQGIQTRVGLLEKEARDLNKIFVTRMTQKRPFVTVKVAQSLDGKIATTQGESRWISGPQARQWVHGLRSQVDALLVGVNTVLKDNPRLTVRLPQARKQPLKVILDSQLKTSPSSRLFSSNTPVLIATTTNASWEKEKRLVQAGAEVLRLPSAGGKISLKALLKELADREISHLLIEGGGEVIASAFGEGVVDQVIWIVAPKVIGGKAAPTSVEGAGFPSLDKAVELKNVSVFPLGTDFVFLADVYRNR